MIPLISIASLLPITRFYFSGRFRVYSIHLRFITVFFQVILYRFMNTTYRPKLGGERQGLEGKRRGPKERIRAGPWDLRSQPTCSQMQVAKSGLVFRGRERGRSIEYRKQKEKLRLMADMVKQAPHPPQSPNASCWSTS